MKAPLVTSPMVLYLVFCAKCFPSPFFTGLAQDTKERAIGDVANDAFCWRGKPNDALEILCDNAPELETAQMTEILKIVN